MSFFQPRTNANFSTSTVHCVLGVQAQEAQLVAIVNSFATPEALDARALNWQERHPIPASAVADPEAWLVSPAGPFAGATVLVASTPLETARSLKWAEIKAERDRRETAGFAYLGKTIDSDARSVQRITIAACAAQAALAAGVPFDVAWTCADDSPLALDARAMAAMPAALAAHADALHRTARALRERLYGSAVDDAVDPAAAVAAIVWPAGAETAPG